MAWRVRDATKSGETEPLESKLKLNEIQRAERSVRRNKPCVLLKQASLRDHSPAPGGEEGLRDF